MDLKKWLKHRASSDFAGDMLVTALLSLVLFLIAMGFMLDYSKNGYVKDQYTKIAQQATDAAVKDQNVRGGFKASAAQTLVREYMYGRYPKSSNEAEAGTMETAAFRNRSGACTSGTIEAYGVTKKVSFPYIEIRFDNKRKLSAYDEQPGPTFVSEAGSKPTQALGVNNKFRVVSVDIWDASENYLLNFIGQPCQKYHIKTSAIAFASKGDINHNREGEIKP